jgi:hypothetical protein
MIKGGGTLIVDRTSRLTDRHKCHRWEKPQFMRIQFLATTNRSCFLSPATRDERLALFPAGSDLADP